MTRRPARATAYAALVTTALLLTGCSSTGDGSTQSDTSSSGGTTSDEAAADGVEAPEAASRLTGEADSAQAAPAVARRAVIATAAVALDSPDVAKSRQEVKRVADVLQGEVSEEEASTDDGRLTWTRMVLRVPTERYEEAIQRIEETGRLLETERSTEDVTTRVIDNDVRIRAQERSLRRVEVLLDRAERIADVVNVEAELTRRQAELDSLKQQQAYLADQTAMATVTVHVSHRDPGEGPVEEDDDGFLPGLSAGWSSLSGTAVALATVAGVLLPWALVLALLGVPAWWAARRLPRRGRGPAEPRQSNG